MDSEVSRLDAEGMCPVVSDCAALVYLTSSLEGGRINAVFGVILTKSERTR
jgi:hypothetical protein